MPLPGVKSRKFVKLNAFSACTRNFDVGVLANIGLLTEAEIPLLLPGAVEEDALAELAGLIGGSDVGGGRIEIGEGLAIDLEGGVGVVEQRPGEISSA